MRQRAQNERGQAFALMVIALIALLGTGAIVMDVGFAWYAKRQVQASADAAALAGAQELPDITAATSTATTYAGLNTPDNLNNVSVNITTRCSVTATAGNWCGPGKSYQANTIAVTETANSPTWFAKIFGINNFGVKGVATACQPCSSSPVDIMLVVDRTGSMCSPTGTGTQYQECLDLNNAKDGVQTLLGIMDPNIDTVGLVAFPPYAKSGGVCGSTSATTNLTVAGTGVPAAQARTFAPNNYDDPNLVYLNDPLASDFKLSALSATLNPASNIVKHMTDDVQSANNTTNGRRCIASFGSTSYDDALITAKAELDKDGRPGVPKVIIFMTDGEANMGSYFGANVPNHGLEPDLADPNTGFDMSPAGTASSVNPGDAEPCHSAINNATAIKAAGVTIYSIGYNLGTAYCVHGVWGQVDGSNASTAYDWQNFKCVAIGTKPSGPYAAKSWALDPMGDGPGHYQGYYTAPPKAYTVANTPTTSAQVGSGETNPCLNKLVNVGGTMMNPHDELPRITSYQTLQSIASPNDFYNKATPGDVTAIFAAIAADITKGTSRLVDDSY